MSHTPVRLAINTFFLFFITLGCFGQTLVEEHWSPYDYPTVIPEGTNHHIIVKGDTLWDLSAHYLGDPLLWPQIYQGNAYIRDPDLIYPGDPIFLDVGVVVTPEAIAESIGEETGVQTDESAEFSDLEAMAEASEEGGEDITNVSDLTSFDADTAEFVILPAGDRSDMECSTYLYAAKSSDAKLPFDFTISGGENRKLVSFAEGDVVYLNKGLDDGVASGEVYSVRRVLEDVYRKGRFVGVAIDQVGKIKIVAVQAGNATALVQASCFEIRAGDFLVPYEQEPIPLITELPDVNRYEAFNKEGSGTIVWSEDKVRSFGKGHLANIDMGIDRNVAPGDLFIIYRANPGNAKAGVKLPEIYLGHGVALKTLTHSTVMKIITSHKEITVGDQVVPLTANSFVD